MTHKFKKSGGIDLLAKSEKPYKKKTDYSRVFTDEEALKTIDAGYSLSPDTNEIRVHKPCGDWYLVNFTEQSCTCVHGFNKYKGACKHLKLVNWAKVRGIV
jgi:hypothetical protein